MCTVIAWYIPHLEKKSVWRNYKNLNISGTWWDIDLVRTLFILIWKVLLNKIKIKEKIFRLTAPFKDLSSWYNISLWLAFWCVWYCVRATILVHWIRWRNWKLWFTPSSVDRMRQNDNWQFKIYFTQKYLDSQVICFTW